MSTILHSLLEVSYHDGLSMLWNEEIKCHHDALKNLNINDEGGKYVNNGEKFWKRIKRTSKTGLFRKFIKILELFENFQIV